MSAAASGPWTIVHDIGVPNHVGISSPEHGEFATVVWRMEDEASSPMCEANAHLVRSAREMLESLQRTESNLSRLIAAKHSDEVLITPWRDEVRALIAKATGSGS